MNDKFLYSSLKSENLSSTDYLVIIFSLLGNAEISRLTENNFKLGGTF